MTTSKLPPLALGCMGMSGMYGPTDDAESIATIHAAIDRGITLLDTGDFYGMGHNEMLIGRALAGRARDSVQLSVKFGGMRGPDGSFIGIDTRPVAIKNFVAYSLKRLGVDYLDIYRPARLDPTVPIEDTIGAIADLVKAGYVRQIGLSEMGVDTIRRANAVHPIVDLQIEYSLVARSPETAIFPALRELGIGATLYGVLSRGLLTGAKPTTKSDFRAHLPRFTGDNAAHNAKAVAALADLATKLGRTPAQLAIAWAAAKQPGFTLLIGSRTRTQLADTLAAMERPLATDELAMVERAVPADAIAGTRYDARQMAALDSER